MADNHNTHSSEQQREHQDGAQQQQPPVRMANLDRITAEKDKLTAKYANNAKNFQKNTGYELDFSKHASSGEGKGEEEEAKK